MRHQPCRSTWEAGFPPVWIHAAESDVRTHPWYVAARSGDADAAALLVADTCNPAIVRQLAAAGAGQAPLLASVHAQEAEGVNAIAEVFAQGLAMLLGWEAETALVQANVVHHRGAIGFDHLGRQAIFDGRAARGRHYLIVDDFIGQGGTIANLRGHIMRQQGVVIGATVLTGNVSSARLALKPATLEELRGKHGNIETWWRQHFGFGFDCLTASEAGFLISTSDSDAVVGEIERLGRA